MTTATQCLDQGAYIYVLIWLVVYYLLAFMCVAYGVLLGAKQGLCVPKLTAHYLTLLLLALFAGGRSGEFSLRIEGSSYYCGTQTPGQFVLDHFLYLGPEVALASLQALTLFWWSRILATMNGPALHTVLMRILRVLLMTLYIGALVVCFWLALRPEQRSIINFVTNIMVIVFEVAMLGSYVWFSWRLSKVYYLLKLSSHQWAKGPAASVRLFTLVGVYSAVCVLIQLVLMSRDSICLATSGHYPGEANSCSKSNQPAPTYNYTDPLPILHLFNFAECSPSVFLLLCLMRVGLTSGGNHAVAGGAGGGAGGARAPAGNRVPVTESEPLMSTSELVDM